MRSKATDAERRLWALLRNKRMAALRFRRQQPIGPYIVDFFCAAVKLIVELDGSQHGTEANLEHDEQRTRFLNMRGYRVLRFSNRHLLKHSEDVLDRIWLAVKESSRPLPEPPRGGSTLPQGEGR